MFDDKRQKVASYLIAMETLGQLNQDGTLLSIERFYDTSFMLPFKLSHELNSYSPELAQRVLQEPTIKNSKTHLFLEFNSPTTYVIRVVVVYSQARILAIDSTKKCFR